MAAVKAGRTSLLDSLDWWMMLLADGHGASGSWSEPP